MDGQDLKQYSTWYVALVLAGVPIASTSVAVGNNAAFLIGLGFIFLGVGEFINHPFRERYQLDGIGRPIWKVSGRARAPKFVGLLVDVVGVVLMGLGLYRVIFS
jgi:hypothetical protein